MVCGGTPTLSQSLYPLPVFHISPDAVLSCFHSPPPHSPSLPLLPSLKALLSLLSPRNSGCLQGKRTGMGAVFILHPFFWMTALQPIIHVSVPLSSFIPLSHPSLPFFVNLVSFLPFHQSTALFLPGPLSINSSLYLSSCHLFIKTLL